MAALKEIENHCKLKKLNSHFFLKIYAIGFQMNRNQLNIQILTEFHKNGNLFEVKHKIKMEHKITIMRLLAEALS